MVRLLILPALFTALILGAVEAGRQQPAEAEADLLLPTPGCDLPCWLGIRPGVDNINRANRILLGAGYYSERGARNRQRLRYTPTDAPGCAVRLELDEFTIIELLLTNCPDLRLGDVISALGAPDGVLPASGSFVFAGGTVSAALQIDTCPPALHPQASVRYIRMVAEDRATRNQADWRGFMPAWRYQQLTPNIIALDC